MLLDDCFSELDPGRQARLLDWLEQASKKGDKAILYFSGHGDVEKQTMWNIFSWQCYAR